MRSFVIDSSSFIVLSFPPARRWYETFAPAPLLLLASFFVPEQLPEDSPGGVHVTLLLIGLPAEDAATPEAPPGALVPGLELHAAHVLLAHLRERERNSSKDGEMERENGKGIFQYPMS